MSDSNNVLQCLVFAIESFLIVDLKEKNKQIKYMMGWNNETSFQGYVTMTMTSHFKCNFNFKTTFPTIRHHFVINHWKDLNVIRSTFVILLLLSENTTSSCVFMHAPGINHLLQILLYDNCQIYKSKVKCDIDFWPHCSFLLFATFPGHKYVFLDIVSLSTPLWLFMWTCFSYCFHILF